MKPIGEGNESSPRPPAQYHVVIKHNRVITSPIVPLQNARCLSCKLIDADAVLYSGPTECLLVTRSSFASGIMVSDEDSEDCRGPA